MNCLSMNSRAGIYLYGDNLEPSTVSKVLNISPTISQKRGETTASSRNSENPIVAKLGMWALISEHHSRDLKDHVEDLLGKLVNASIPLNLIDGVCAGYVDIVYFGPNDECSRTTAELKLSKAHIEMIERLGLGIHFTSY